jgi:hypothetical protein
MGQIFSRNANTFIRGWIFGILVLIPCAAFAVWKVWWSPYMTLVRVPLDQPAPFSHQHHVGGLGIDCRYCHTTVEHSAFAGLPATETCMTCHSQIWTDAPMLEPVRESMARQRPIEWNRVNNLPEFVFFNHGIHVSKGIGCSTCHGLVNTMPLTWKEHSLYMKWCLDCHKEPERFIRPRAEVFNMDWKPGPDQLAAGRKLVNEYHVQTSQLTDCGICHR